MTDDRTLPSQPSTWLCRCEEVSPEEVRAALAAGARSLNDIKRRTRAGMGPCQGIYCQAAAAALLASETGVAPGRIPPITARPPVRPIPLERLAHSKD